MVLKVSTLCDSEITSGRINFKSNEQYKRIVEWYNKWINGSSSYRKASKLPNIGITDWKSFACSLLTGCLNLYTNLISLLCFSSGSFSVGSSSKSKLDRRYDSKVFHCVNFLSRLNHRVETWLITFVTSLLSTFMNSLSCLFRFALLRKW